MSDTLTARTESVEAGPAGAGLPVDPIEIRTARPAANNLKSLTGWRDVKKVLHAGAAARLKPGAEGRLDEMALVAGFLEEAHHRDYGRPWVLGRANFDVLIELGLQRQDRVLDFGCGAGRHANYLIPYLEPGRYFGVDAHYLSLLALATYENYLHGLAERQPRLLWDDAFAFDSFGTEFDLILDAYTSWHIPRAQMPAMARALAGVLAPGGRILICPTAHIDARVFEAAGLRVGQRHESVCDWLRGTRHQPRTDWVELRRAVD